MPSYGGTTPSWAHAINRKVLRPVITANRIILAKPSETLIRFPILDCHTISYLSQLGDLASISLPASTKKKQY
ncbi:hypothetical protein ACFLVZ_02215 [Chloroflexota bacterium]